MLKAVNYGWNREKLARNAKQISELGSKLYDDRLRLLAGHITQVGTGLDRAVVSRITKPLGHSKQPGAGFGAQVC